MSFLQCYNMYSPSLDGYEDYEQFKKNLFSRYAMSSVAAEKHAPTRIGHLNGQAQISAKTLPLLTLTSDTGLGIVMA